MVEKAKKILKGFLFGSVLLITSWLFVSTIVATLGSDALKDLQKQEGQIEDQILGKNLEKSDKEVIKDEEKKEYEDAQSDYDVVVDEIDNLNLQLESVRGKKDAVMNQEESPETVAASVAEASTFEVVADVSKPLFYVFKESEGTYVSQSPKQHFANNGYLATDIATGGRYLEVHAPSWDWIDDEGNYYDESRSYTVAIKHNFGTMGKTVELHWEEDEKNYNFAVGHFKEIWVEDGQKVKTGDKLGSSGGCPGDLQENEASTGCHVHLELRLEGEAIGYPTWESTPHSEDLEALKKYREKTNESTVKTEEYDIDKLAYAIAMAETGDCTTGMGKTKNNCFGIMTWESGTREGKVFDSKEQAYKHFKYIWTTKYNTPLKYHSVYSWVHGSLADPTDERIDEALQYLENALFYYNQ